MNRADRCALAARLLGALPSPGVQPADLAETLKEASFLHFPGGGALCTEGERAQGLFILVEGKVRVQRRDPNARMRKVATMRAPALVGHMALIDDSPRSASCVAVGRVSVASLDRGTVRRLLGEASSRGAAWRRLLLSSLTRQLTLGNARIRRLMAAGDAGALDEDTTAVELMDVAGLLDGWGVRDAAAVREETPPG